MAIHALSLVKNEADIIEANLTAALKWCDHIYVLDNGSTDGTWDAVRDMSRKFSAIIPFKQDPKPFSDSLRHEIFAQFRRLASAGDWWCVLDADEFYIDDPREFLARVPSEYQSVWPQLYTYLFTEIDAANSAKDPKLYGTVSASSRLRHYVLGEYSEPRFIRHHSSMRRFPPDNVRPIYPRPIRMSHYPYRSPAQIALRLTTRVEPMTRGEFAHEKRSNWVPGGSFTLGPADVSELSHHWEERIVRSDDCLTDDGPDTLLPPLPSLTAWLSSPEAGVPIDRPRSGLKKLVDHLKQRFAHAHA